MEPCDPRMYLAAERTFLAWIRTGLALMGFGFVVAQFALFMRHQSEQVTWMTGNTVLLASGVTLIVLGVFIHLGAALRHRRHILALDRGQFRPAFGSTFAFTIAGFLAIIGLMMAVYLISIQ